MDWVNTWLKDVAYLLTGVVFVFVVAITYTLFQLVEDWLQRRYTKQAKQPQKVEGKVKQPMGFL
jgi:peptidoglycan/LPS O-acetylase OafA/YrhL